MSNERILSGGRAMRVICDATMVALPLSITVGLIAWPEAVRALAGPAGLRVAEGVTPFQTWVAVAAGLVPLAVMLWTIWQMRQLFALFARGAVLTPMVAARIRRIGQGFLALALLPLVVIPVQSVLLSWANPEGERSLSVIVNSNMLGFAVASALLILIGWAMGQAAEVAEENRAFV